MYLTLHKRGSNVWEGDELVFVLDHINGDWKNHRISNLRMICPNCNSQLETTKHKKRGSGRWTAAK